MPADVATVGTTALTIGVDSSAIGCGATLRGSPVQRQGQQVEVPDVAGSDHVLGTQGVMLRADCWVEDARPFQFGVRVAHAE